MLLSLSLSLSLWECSLSQTPRSVRPSPPLSLSLSVCLSVCLSVSLSLSPELATVHAETEDVTDPALCNITCPAVETRVGQNIALHALLIVAKKSLSSSLCSPSVCLSVCLSVPPPSLPSLFLPSPPSSPSACAWECSLDYFCFLLQY